MAINFFNVKTGETRTVSTEPQIAALYNSSDQHVNAKAGQDMGWRIAPETIKRMREIQNDQAAMDRIATMFQLPMGEVADTDVLRYISVEDARKEAAEKDKSPDFTRQYEDEVRAIDDTPAAAPVAEEPSTPESAEEEDIPDKPQKVAPRTKTDSEVK